MTIEENVSLYPPEVMDTIDAQKEDRIKRIRIMVLIIVIFVILAALVAVAAIGIGKGNFQLAGIGESESEEIYEEPVEEFEEVEEELPEEETEESNEEEAEEEAEDAPRVVSDANGDYYDYSERLDDAGDVIFEAIYPEDFDNINEYIEYDRFSDRYPIRYQFVASGEDGGIQFVYISPEQYWYKLSETGKTRSNERDPSYYMSFYQYGGAKKYIEDILKASYPKGKYECTNEKEISSLATAGTKELADYKSDKLSFNIGDYAHIGEGTTYANMDSEYSALVYDYEIVTKDKQIVFDRFYVPVIANNLYYANETYNDRGTVTEWYILAFVVMEAGNEDLFDDYSDAFDIFAVNAVPTERFMKINQIYAEEIKESVAAKRAVDPMTEDMLATYSKESESGYSLDEFNKMVLDILNKAGGKIFEAGDTKIRTGKDINVAFLDKEIGKLYVSKDASEYPGDEFTELSLGWENQSEDTIVEAASEETLDEATEDEQ